MRPLPGMYLRLPLLRRAKLQLLLPKTQLKPKLLLRPKPLLKQRLPLMPRVKLND